MTNRINTRELVELSLICAIMFAGKEAMNFIPNVHPVLLIIIATTLVYGWAALYPVIAYVLLEMAVFGFGIWTISYFYIWTIAVCLVMLLRNNESRLFWAAIAGGYGLIFGALCAIPYLFISGWAGALSYWVAGIPFDLIHGASSAVMVYFLVTPLTKIMRSLHNMS